MRQTRHSHGEPQRPVHIYFLCERNLDEHQVFKNDRVDECYKQKFYSTTSLYLKQAYLYVVMANSHRKYE